MARINIWPWPLRLGLSRSGASMSSGSVDGCMPISGTSLALKMHPLHTSDGILNLDTLHGTEAGPALEQASKRQMVVFVPLGHQASDFYPCFTPSIPAKRRGNEFKLDGLRRG
jgi:hypothetical protein